MKVFCILTKRIGTNDRLSLSVHHAENMNAMQSWQHVYKKYQMQQEYKMKTAMNKSFIRFIWGHISLFWKPYIFCVSDFAVMFWFAVAF